MLFFLAACTIDSDPAGQGTTDDTPVAASSGWTGAPSSSMLFVTSNDMLDPRLVEIDTTGKAVLDFPLSQLFPTWDDLNPKPSPMDVTPTSADSFLVAFYGYGLIEFDRQGNTIWRHEDPEASHDVDRLANGNTLYARPWVAQGEPGAVEIDPAGNTVWSWDGVATYGSDTRFDGYKDEGDAWMHINAVQRLDSGLTSLCVRNFNSIVQVDTQGAVQREITFQSEGSAHTPATEGNLQGMHPHAAEWIPGAGLSVALRGPDRVVVMNAGVKQRDLRDPSLVGITDMDALPNGHTVYATHGLLRETDAAGATVWEWNQTDNSQDVDSDRARHVFTTIVPLGADGASLDND